jgi:hypothetical protein
MMVVGVVGEKRWHCRTGSGGTRLGRVKVVESW